ncbi:hypothetical protein K227x_27940 [Rubripirellula lacrimiformis]|uniref:Uncharacterized protein n=1 Tax=Rubripirellula lacrimiformis TaxID=1930273 RepID=A0A517NBA0_9BACT|nr:hypothetical protein K227x_27940 [Rubripirellula lacrimiformis]
MSRLGQGVDQRRPFDSTGRSLTNFTTFPSRTRVTDYVICIRHPRERDFVIVRTDDRLADANSCNKVGPGQARSEPPRSGCACIYH